MKKIFLLLCCSAMVCIGAIAQTVSLKEMVEMMKHGENGHINNVLLKKGWVFDGHNVRGEAEFENRPNVAWSYEKSTNHTYKAFMYFHHDAANTQNNYLIYVFYNDAWLEMMRNELTTLGFTETFVKDHTNSQNHYYTNGKYIVTFLFRAKDHHWVKIDVKH